MFFVKSFRWLSENAGCVENACYTGTNMIYLLITYNPIMTWKEFLNIISCGCLGKPAVVVPIVKTAEERESFCANCK